MKAAAANNRGQRGHYCTCTVRIVNTARADATLFSGESIARVTGVQQPSVFIDICCSAAEDGYNRVIA
ncbi:hypothetical protein [Paraburkholderia aromaticivorans]|uniref:hypothetical protein n=1 Tax=Paraburkholderia aromaticivorans TaxID=2026199 RepID=UPI001455DFD0|nr:hypothetical protein [Paraburkholderia aromaticivorans]